MVGVPGRSKACHTCRRRRKACDQKRPSCGPCMLSRVPCGGYEQNRIFINSGQEQGSTNNGAHRFQVVTYSAAHSQLRVSAEDQLPSPVLERTLEHSALEAKYLEFFWTSLLPYGQAFPSQAAQYSTTSWTSAIQDLCHKDPLVRFVLLANALTATAQQTKQQSLLLQGSRLYGLSLQAVARSLADKKRRDWGKILAASGLLASYEVDVCLFILVVLLADGLAAPTWLRHTSGEMSIILAGGPGNFIDGSAHQLFVDHRLHLIYPYVQTFQRCALSSVEWKTVPWSKHSKSPKDELIDVLIEIPGLLEEMAALDDLSMQPSERDFVSQALEERCWWCDHQLLLWSTTCGEATVSFVESLIAGQDLDNNSSESAPSSTHLAMAHLGMIYWTTYNLLSQILFFLRQTIPSRESTKQLPPRIDAHSYTRKVALLIPYFHNPGVGSYLISFIGFPVAVAASFLLRQKSAAGTSEAGALFDKAFRGEQGKHLQKFLAAWPWMTQS